MKTTEKFSKLLDIISALRHPETGCPWDLEQNLDTLTRYAIEEANEYVSAVASEDNKEICDELGDILLQVVLNAKVAEQEKRFNIDNVIDSISEKMIRRHPHVFSDEKLKTTEEIKVKWEEIKQQEKQSSPTDKLFSIPKSLSGNMEAFEIGKKSTKLNFDWNSPLAVLEKVKEELTELEDEILAKKRNPESIEHEVGDLLFSCVQLARHLEVNPELAIKKCNQRFYNRFSLVLEQIPEGKSTSDYTSEELEKLWTIAKTKTK